MNLKNGPLTPSPRTKKILMSGKLTSKSFYEAVAAENMQMSRPTLSAIETGKRQVTANELVQFAELYKVDVSELLYENDDSNRKRVMEYYQRFVALSEEKQIEVMRYIDDVER